MISFATFDVGHLLLATFHHANGVFTRAAPAQRQRWKLPQKSTEKNKCYKIEDAQDAQDAQVYLA